MIEKVSLKKKIKYRSEYRGIKEMDLLLGKFVKKYVDNLSYEELLYGIIIPEVITFPLQLIIVSTAFKNDLLNIFLIFFNSDI